MKLKIILAVIISYLALGCAMEWSKEHEISPVLFKDTTATVFEEIETGDKYYNDLILQKVSDFYRAYGYKTRWLNEKRPYKMFVAFEKVVEKSNDYGISSKPYNINGIRQKLDAIYADSQVNKEELCAIDREITAKFLLYITHLNQGRLRHAGYGEKYWIKEDKGSKEVEALLRVDYLSDLKEMMDTLHSGYYQYNRLLKVLDSIKTNQNQPNTVIVLEKYQGFKEGWKSKEVKKLRNVMVNWGFSPPVLNDSVVVDSNLIAAVKMFQKKRGLTVNGILDNETVNWLNLNTDRLKEMVELNLERMRWLPRKFNEHLIFVNIPDYTLKIYEQEQETLKMNVIVGSEYNPTPIFNDTLRYLVFSPTWTVPQSIVNEEMIPKLIDDPSYYSDRGFKIFENEEEVNPKKIKWKKEEDISKRYFTFVQQPGPTNALGRVKFIMPNSHSIYLHDTPGSHHFKKDERALSHGCIRVSEPAALAAYLLRNEKEWDKTKIEASLNLDTPLNVNLKTPYQVQLAYLTSWVDDDGILELRKDVYGFDTVHLKMLRKLEKPL